MAPPIEVLIPVRDQHHLTESLLDQLQDQGGYAGITVFDNGSGPAGARWLAGRTGRGGVDVVDAAGSGIYDMWQDGVERARHRSPGCDVAILNNDLVVGPDFLGALGRALHSDTKLWAVSPRYDDRSIDGVEYVTGTWKGGGLAGFAFLVRGTAFDHIAFDRSFHVWFGDDDLVAQIERLGRKVGITGDTWVEHVDGGSQTLRRRRGVIELLARDYERMIAKWGDVGPIRR